MWPFNKIKAWLDGRLGTGDKPGRDYYDQYNGYWNGTAFIRYWIDPKLKCPPMYEAIKDWQQFVNVQQSITFAETVSEADAHIKVRAYEGKRWTLQDRDGNTVWAVTNREAADETMSWAITGGTITMITDLDEVQRGDSLTHEMLHIFGVQKHSSNPNDAGYARFRRGIKLTDADKATVVKGWTVRRAADIASKQK